MEQEKKCLDCGATGVRMATKKYCDKCYYKRRKGPAKVKVRPVTNCESCNGDFSKVGYYAKNLCSPCYSNRKRGLKFKLRTNNKVDKNQLCQCGKPVKASNMCISCYNKWRKANSFKSCQRCGTSYKTFSTIPFCLSCRSVSKEAPGLTELLKTQMRLLLTKDKWGFMGHIERLRVLDVYLQIVNYDDYLIKLDEVGCITYCLSKFKEWL
jgi:hypothetical protein